MDKRKIKDVTEIEISHNLRLIFQILNNQFLNSLIFLASRIDPSNVFHEYIDILYSISKI